MLFPAQRSVSEPRSIVEAKGSIITFAESVLIHPLVSSTDK